MIFLDEKQVNVATPWKQATATFWNPNMYNPSQFYIVYVYLSVTNFVCTNSRLTDLLANKWPVIF